MHDIYDNHAPTAREGGKRGTPRQAVLLASDLSPRECGRAVAESKGRRLRAHLLYPFCVSFFLPIKVCLFVRLPSDTPPRERIGRET